MQTALLVAETLSLVASVVGLRRSLQVADLPDAVTFFVLIVINLAMARMTW